MKNFLMAAIAVFMMAGTSVAAGFENSSVAENAVISNQQKQNVIDKMIVMIKGYTKKVNAVKSAEELLKVSEQCFEEMKAFEEKHADEIMAIEGTLTEAQMKKYEAALDKALSEFESAVEKKTNELMNYYNLQ